MRIGIPLLAALFVAACASEPTGPVGPDSLSLVCGPSDVTVSVGQSVRPAAGSEACRLSAAPGAEYALAILDVAAIESADSGGERSFWDYAVTVTVDGPSAHAGAALAAMSGAQTSVDPAFDVVAVSGSADGLESPAFRERPWAPDERFEILDPYDGVFRTARVLRVYGGAFVVAWYEHGDSTRLRTWLPRLDTAFAVVRERAFPLLRATFVDAAPRTSSGSGQYLILLRDSLPLESLPAAIGVAYSTAVGDTAYTWIHLKVEAAYPLVSLVSLLTHEMTHSYERMHMHATRSSVLFGSSSGAAKWGSEGVANLISYEVLRRIASLPLDANYDWRAPQAGAEAQLVARRAQPGTGEFTAGYDNSMGFLRHLVVRLMAAGSTVEGAVREVALGAIEGWHGYDGESRRRGLVRRMRPVLGYRWDPAEAVLDWTLSHAADDLTENAEFQDRTSLRVWDIPAGQAGWRAGAVLSSDSGGSASVSRRYGSPLFIYLRDGGGGIAFRVEAHRTAPYEGCMPCFNPPVEELRWKLVRIR